MALLAVIALAPGVVVAQMGMGSRGGGSMGRGMLVEPREPPSGRAAPASDPSSRPASGQDGDGPAITTAQMPAPPGMGHRSTPRPFYQERTFMVLVGAAGAAAGIVVLRAARRRRHRPAAPSAFATEAVLVVDIVGSTHLATQYGETVAMQARTAIKDRLLSVAPAHGLRFVENTGDGCLATFGSVAAALATASAVLEGLRAHPPDLAPAPPLAVRIGIAWGEILFDDHGNRHGAVINKAFRLEGVRPAAFVRMEGEQAHPPVAEHNRVFLDEAAAEEARTAGAPVREVGFAALKGFPGLHRVYEVSA